MTVFTLERGTAPLLISLPHDGTQLPRAFAQRLSAPARVLPDTDWHVSRLYAFARELGASLLKPNYSRYVVDLNRPPDDAALYPGQNSTGLCPVQRFDGGPIYRDGQQPDAGEVAERRQMFWQPYHDALSAEIDHLQHKHGRVLLWEAHSIRGQCPFLFDGPLPDFNIGTADGRSCNPQLQARVEACLAAQCAYSWVANGRFKGGYITRHYGRPDAGVDAVQLELAQRNYMDEDSFAWLPERAARLQVSIRELLVAALD
jgi:N-formylglutamate deformylase